MIHITLTEVVTSLTMYLILHTLIWFGRNVEKFAATEYHHLIIIHKRQGHGGKLRHCESCSTGTAQEIQQLVPELPQF